MGNVSYRPATTATATVDFIFSVATKEKLQQQQQQQQLMHEQMSFRARRHTKKGRGKVTNAMTASSSRECERERGRELLSVSERQLEYAAHAQCCQTHTIDSCFFLHLTRNFELCQSADTSSQV